jgi:hypothetical protein
LAVFVCAATAVTLYLSPPASGQEGREQLQADVARSLESFDALELDPAAALKSARNEGRLKLVTSRGEFDITLEPFDVRAANWRGVVAGDGGRTTEMERAPTNTFRGVVQGKDGSQVRLILDGERVEGVILTGDETFFVERASNYSASARDEDLVFYSQSAIRQDSFGECGTTLAHRVGEEARRVAANTGVATAVEPSDTPTPKIFAPRPEVELATEADFEYFQAFSNNSTAAQTEINQIVAMVDGFYEAQLGIEIRIVFSRVWNNANDPYTLTNASQALGQFAGSYDNSFGPEGQPPHRDLTHMWTGKDFTGSTIGIAFTGVACVAEELSYGISQRSVSNPGKFVLTAHEIGHNFGAEHPDQLTPPVAECAGTIMNSSVTPGTTFCQLSRDQITSHTASLGSCLTRLTQPGCLFTLSPSGHVYGVDGGTGSITVTTSAGCSWDVAEGAPWLTVNSGAPGTGSSTVNFTVAPNTGGPRRVDVEIGGRTVTIRQAASPSCGVTMLNIGQSVSGELTSSDCRLGEPVRPGAFVDLYAFAARAGQRVRIEMTAAVPPASNTPPSAPDLDTYLYLYRPDGSVLEENDDILLGEETDSRIPLADFFQVPQTGIYVISATSFGSEDAGAYTLKLSDNSAASTVSFSSAAYVVNEGVGADGLGTEGTGFVTITVNRTGDRTGTATVDYTLTNGTADRRRDFIQSLGTLVFEPGQASKTFRVLINDDVFSPNSVQNDVLVEAPAETLNLALSSPIGTTLGGQTTAVLTVNDNDTTPGQLSPAKSAPPTSPDIFNRTFFVRQHYLDFLNREPDAGGLAFWRDRFLPCDALTGEAFRNCQRGIAVNVSAAFFLSIEFQETGYLVYRFYKAAYGDATAPPVAGTVPVIRLEEFLPDTQRISQGVQVGIGDWKAQLEANKAAFAEEFVIRPRFLAAYPLTMTPTQFVDTLNQQAGGALSPAERDALIDDLRAGRKTRGAVLRAVAQDPTLSQAELNRAFVLMQYYGYMRRNPNDPRDTDFSGWKFWLDQLNSHGGNFEGAEMVRAFIESFEYTDRFGN